MKQEMTSLGKVGLIGRFKPLHNGGYIMLEAACEQAESVTIGIGSSNKYNLRNPFTGKESEEMICSALKPKFSNYQIVHIPDFAHMPQYRDGQKWRGYVLETFGKLNYFISSNDYVANLLKNDYKIIHPSEIIPAEKQIPLRATEVRYEIAKFGNWKELVPKAVALYLEKNFLIDRFRKEFGIETIAQLAFSQELKEEDLEKEKLHAQEN